jgi:hypothetical protein
MKHAIVYHFFSDGEPYQNDQHPIILSIATQRFFDRDVKIYVLDASCRIHKTVNWAHFPKLLDFEVVSTEPTDAPMPIKLCAKPLDTFNFLPQVDADIIQLCDCDVFRLRHWLPFMGDHTKLCSANNTGYSYFRPDSKGFELWASMCSLALNSPQFRSKVIEALPHKQDIHDETVFQYVKKQHNGLTCRIPPYENYRIKFFMENDIVQNPHLESIKTIHHATNALRQRRGWAMMQIQEVRNALALLDDSDLKLMYDDVPPIRASVLEPASIRSLFQEDYTP